MARVTSAVILSFFLLAVNQSFAQKLIGGSKVFSGPLHHFSVESKKPFWHVFLSKSFPKQDIIVKDWQCFIEFKSPIPFSNQSVSVLPEHLNYRVKFRNDPISSPADLINENDVFEKYIIKIYSTDDQEYTIDPQAEGQKTDINGEHQIFDSYLIYLILGKEIDHIEILGASGNQDKYVLDKLEIHNNR